MSTSVSSTAPSSPTNTTTMLTAWIAAVAVVWVALKAPDLELVKESVSAAPGVDAFAPFLSLVTPGAVDLGSSLLVFVTFCLALYQGGKEEPLASVERFPAFVFFVVPGLAAAVNGLPIAAAAVVLGILLATIFGPRGPGRARLFMEWVVVSAVGYGLAYLFAVV